MKSKNRTWSKTWLWFFLGFIGSSNSCQIVMTETHYSVSDALLTDADPIVSWKTLERGLNFSLGILLHYWAALTKCENVCKPKQPSPIFSPMQPCQDSLCCIWWWVSGGHWSSLLSKETFWVFYPWVSLHDTEGSSCTCTSKITEVGLHCIDPNCSIRSCGVWIWKGQSRI